MGSSVNFGSKGGGRRRRRFKPMNEINVTPFVDVMLTLLIIFMVSAPLMTAGVEINLPETAAGALQGGAKGEPLSVTIDARGRIFIQDAEVAADEMVPKIKAIARNGLQESIFVRGDSGVDYGAVMRVMGGLKEAGFTRLQLVTTQKAGGG